MKLITGSLEHLDPLIYPPLGHFGTGYLDKEYYSCVAHRDGKCNGYGTSIGAGGGGANGGKSTVLSSGGSCGTGHGRGDSYGRGRDS